MTKLVIGSLIVIAISSIMAIGTLSNIIARRIANKTEIIIVLVCSIFFAAYSSLGMSLLLYSNCSLFLILYFLMAHFIVACYIGFYKEKKEEREENKRWKELMKSIEYYKKHK